MNKIRLGKGVTDRSIAANELNLVQGGVSLSHFPTFKACTFAFLLPQEVEWAGSIISSRKRGSKGMVCGYVE